MFVLSSAFDTFYYTNICSELQVLVFKYFLTNSIPVVHGSVYPQTAPSHFLLPARYWSGLRLPEAGHGDADADYNATLRDKCHDTIPDSTTPPDTQAGK